MSKKMTRRVTLKDKDIPTHKTKTVKGGLLATTYGRGSFAVRLDDGTPEIIVGAGPGAPGGHVK